MKTELLALHMVGGLLVASCATVGASIITADGGDLIVIDDAGNSSNGLRFLHMSFGDSLNQADALTNAQGTYANARVATPSETADLFSAAGIVYDSATLDVTDGWEVGASVDLSTGTNYNADLLNALGFTQSTSGGNNALFWTDPDGSNNSTSTRDRVLLTATEASIQQANRSPAFGSVGWLLVSEAASSSAAVPEPGAASLLGLSTLIVGIHRWRRKRRAN